MSNLKKTVVAILVFGNSAVFSGSMGSVCRAENVTVPCKHSAWEFAGQALYLQSTVGGQNFAGYETTNGIQSYKNSGNKWGWGFKLDAAYHYATGKDIDVNWYHMSNTKNGVLAGPLTNQSGLVYAGPIQQSREPKWDAANLELGQHVDFSQTSSVRFHGGVQYVNIDEKSNYSSPGTGIQVRSTNRHSTYSGFGPRIGADMTYGFDNGLSAYANGALGMLAGTSRYNNLTLNAIGAVTGRSLASMIIVPEIEVKLGGMYTHAMPQGDLSLNAGWMWINYFQVTTPIISGDVHSENFGFQGPFVGLKWVGNIA